MSEQIEGVEEAKLYTVFNYPKSLTAPHTLTVEGENGDSNGSVLPPYLTLPHAPRLSLDGSKGIVTGIYGEAPECLHLSQSEAEVLMTTKEWNDESIA